MGNAFHDAYVAKTDDCPHGFFRHGPPSASAAASLRSRRRGVAASHDARFAGSAHGAVACRFCWLHGHSAVKCRVKAPGCYNHGPNETLVKGVPVGGPDFDARLLGERVAVHTSHPKLRRYEGVVTAFDAATGECTVTSDAGDTFRDYLSYVTCAGMDVLSDAWRAAAPAAAPVQEEALEGARCAREAWCKPLRRVGADASVRVCVLVGAAPRQARRRRRCPACAATRAAGRERSRARPSWPVV
jgi:hypothetical protein